MVSYATGVAPSGAAGRLRDTRPTVRSSGRTSRPAARSPRTGASSSSEPKRDLGFRFGYYDKHNANHLIIMKRKKS